MISTIVNAVKAYYTVKYLIVAIGIVTAMGGCWAIKIHNNIKNKGRLEERQANERATDKEIVTRKKVLRKEKKSDKKIIRKAEETCPGDKCKKNLRDVLRRKK